MLILLYTIYLDRRGTIGAIENFPVTALTTYTIHCAVFFGMDSPKQKQKEKRSILS